MEDREHDQQEGDDDPEPELAAFAEEIDENHRGTPS